MGNKIHQHPVPRLEYIDPVISKTDPILIEVVDDVAHVWSPKGKKEVERGDYLVSIPKEVITELNDAWKLGFPQCPHCQKEYDVFDENEAKEPFDEEDWNHSNPV
tara:strand:- start:1623 stop:1937 length:315 start_codon:yes stop_codon:yes gene_type:complete